MKNKTLPTRPRPRFAHDQLLVSWTTRMVRDLTLEPLIKRPRSPSFCYNDSLPTRYGQVISVPVMSVWDIFCIYSDPGCGAGHMGGVLHDIGQAVSYGAWSWAIDPVWGSHFELRHQNAVNSWFEPDSLKIVATHGFWCVPNIHHSAATPIILSTFAKSLSIHCGLL